MALLSTPSLNFFCPQARLTCSQEWHRHLQGVGELCSYINKLIFLMWISQLLLISFYLKVHWSGKMKTLSCGFVLHCTFIMCEGTVSISKALEENFCLTQQCLNCKTFSLSPFWRFLSNLRQWIRKSYMCWFNQNLSHLMMHFLIF